MQINNLVALRNCNHGDINFVYSSWLRSLRQGSAYYRSIPHKIYFKAHEASIKNTLTESSVVIASPVSEPEIIVGYLVWEDRSDRYVVLHYCYVKKEFRRMGLATHMINSIAGDRDLIATHYTDKFRNVHFNPYFFKQEYL